MRLNDKQLTAIKKCCKAYFKNESDSLWLVG